MPHSRLLSLRVVFHAKIRKTRKVVCSPAFPMAHSPSQMAAIDFPFENGSTCCPLESSPILRLNGRSSSTCRRICLPLPCLVRAPHLTHGYCSRAVPSQIPSIIARESTSPSHVLTSPDLPKSSGSAIHCHTPLCRLPGLLVLCPPSLLALSVEKLCGPHHHSPGGLAVCPRSPGGSPAGVSCRYSAHDRSPPQHMTSAYVECAAAALPRPSCLLFRCFPDCMSRPRLSRPSSRYTNSHRKFTGGGWGGSGRRWGSRGFKKRTTWERSNSRQRELTCIQRNACKCHTQPFINCI